MKTEATDGYSAVQVGYQVCKEKHITKPELKHLAKSGAPAMRKLKEYRVSLAARRRPSLGTSLWICTLDMSLRANGHVFSIDQGCDGNVCGHAVGQCGGV